MTFDDYYETESKKEAFPEYNLVIWFSYIDRDYSWLAITPGGKDKTKWNTGIVPCRK